MKNKLQRTTSVQNKPYVKHSIFNNSITSELIQAKSPFINQKEASFYKAQLYFQQNHENSILPNTYEQIKQFYIKRKLYSKFQILSFSAADFKKYKVDPKPIQVKQKSPFRVSLSCEKQRSSLNSTHQNISNIFELANQTKSINLQYRNLETQLNKIEKQKLTPIDTANIKQKQTVHELQGNANIKNEMIENQIILRKIFGETIKYRKFNMKTINKNFPMDNLVENK